MKFGAGKDQKGVTLMVTLGTGIGCGLFMDGVLVPNTEFGHIELDGKDAEDRAAASARELKKLSWKVWAKRVETYLAAVDKLVWPDLIIIGGGVSATPQKFFPYIKTRAPMVAATMGNDAGIVGAALWAAAHGAQASGVD